ncbi:MAG: class II aldolase/adducin family protein, partial [Candidatus Eisenbacteria bacterium]|nr:class II aldolase/adducin family protein [Candidatus Eisenbacteria bacterium]
LMPEVAVNLGAVPLTPYATPGTPALEEAILPAVRNYDAFLLANHGAVTMGNTVDQALERMETLEHFAKITLVTHLLGGATALGPSDVQSLEAIRARVNPRPVNCDPAAPISPGLPPRGKASDISEAQITETVTRVVRQILGDTES